MRVEIKTLDELSLEIDNACKVIENLFIEYGNAMDNLMLEHEDAMDNLMLEHEDAIEEAEIVRERLIYTYNQCADNQE